MILAYHHPAVARLREFTELVAEAAVGPMAAVPDPDTRAAEMRHELRGVVAEVEKMIEQVRGQREEWDQMRQRGDLDQMLRKIYPSGAERGQP